MQLHEYFAETRGTGIMATSDRNGVVDTAVYSSPHVQENDTVVFIMRDRLSHKNLEENGHANYLFMEECRAFKGVRLFLTMIEEIHDQALIDSMTRRHLSPEEDRARGEKFLVRFKVDKVLPLVGGKELPIA